MNSNRQPDRMEQLLRSQRGVGLSPAFRREVMESISHLPDPELLPALRRPRLTLMLTIGVLTLLLGAVALAVPHYSATLAAWQWELDDLNVALSVGGTALSASLLSLLCVAAGASVLTALGVYGRRNHLIGA